MRTALSAVFCVALSATGCVGYKDVTDGPCDQLLRCAALTDPGKLNEHIGTYGAEGSCWKSVPHDLCEATCSKLLDGYAASSPKTTECGPIPPIANLSDASVTDGSASMTDGGASTDGGPADMGGSCGPASCAGCCMGGVCQPGTANSACGGGGMACAPCASPMVCDAIARTCGANPDEVIKLTIYDADIYSRKSNGDPWDFPSGYPDVFVTIDGVRRTTVEDDTIYPYWDKTLYMTRRELMNTGVYVAVWDEDISYNDRISYSKLLKVTDADLLVGKIEWRAWDDVKRIQFNVSR